METKEEQSQELTERLKGMAIEAGAREAARKVGAIEKLNECMDKEEIVKMTYLPIIVTRIVFNYCKELTAYCAKHRLNFKKEMRTIKDCMKEYEHTALSGATENELKQLTDATNGVMKECGTNFMHVWLAVNGELKKEYPNINRKMYDVASYALTIISLILYSNAFERKQMKRVFDATGIMYESRVAEFTDEIRVQCAKVMEGLELRNDSMLQMAMSVVKNKMDIEFSVKTEQ